MSSVSRLLLRHGPRLAAQRFASSSSSSSDRSALAIRRGVLVAATGAAAAASAVYFATQPKPAVLSTLAAEENPIDDAINGDDSSAADRPRPPHPELTPAPDAHTPKPAAAGEAAAPTPDAAAAPAPATQASEQGKGEGDAAPAPKEDGQAATATAEGEAEAHPPKHPLPADVDAATHDAEARMNAALAEVAVSEELRRIQELEKQLEDHLEHEVQRLQSLLAQQREHDAGEHAKLLDSERERLKKQWHDEVVALRKDFEQTLSSAIENERYASTLQLQQHLFVVAQENQRTLEEQLSKQAKKIWELSEAERKTQLTRDRVSNVKMLEEMNLKLKSVETVLSNHVTVEDTVRQCITATAALEVARRALESKKPLAGPVKLLRSAVGSDEFVSIVIGSLSARALNKGVPSMEELVARFGDVRRQAESVSLVPVGGGVFYHMMSSLVHSLSFKVDGPLEGDSVEAIMSRAEHHLRKGDLDQATREVNQLQGTPRQVAASWLQDSRAYLEAKQALDAAIAYVSVRAASVF
eukprot:m.109375 g.109375  ORF g.109375 m.109375 type:complete len:527 (+) comp15889_c0_seq1:41-1621(+)